MIQDGIRKTNFLTNNQLRLIETLYNNKYIEISRIKDKDVKAILFVMRNNDNVLFWIDLYDNNTYAGKKSSVK